MIKITTVAQGAGWVQIPPLHYDPGRYTEPLYVAVNGETYIVPRGVSGLYVPPAVKEAIDNGYRMDGVIDSSDFDPEPPVEPSGTISITENGTYDVTDKAMASVNVSGSAPAEEAPAGAVTFYDYDGRALYSYSDVEFLELEAMPANPEHDGLTSQGWNWSLADAQDYVRNYYTLNIGQMYAPTDGKTHIHITVDTDGRTIVPIRLGINPDVTADWGDESQAEILTGNNKDFTHQLQIGDFDISLAAPEGEWFTFGGDMYTNCMFGNRTGGRAYPHMLKRLVLGEGTRISGYSLYECTLDAFSMPKEFVEYTGTKAIPSNMFYGSYARCIIIPDTATGIGSSAFSSCPDLERVVMPSGVTSIGDNAFSGCYRLKAACIPDTVTTIGKSAFNNCYTLASIVIPASVTTIGNSAFANCKSMNYYDFAMATAVPTIGTSVFSGIPDDCEIWVPEALEATWKAADNWSDYASYIVGV